MKYGRIPGNEKTRYSFNRYYTTLLCFFRNFSIGTAKWSFSKFEDIYDEDHFISTLDGYVKVVRQLPKSLMEKYAGNETSMPNLRVPAWATVKYYLSEVYPVLRTHGYWVSSVSRAYKCEFRFQAFYTLSYDAGLFGWLLSRIDCRWTCHLMFNSWDA